MHQPRDFYQRKVYAVVRMSLAMIRLGKAETDAEKDKAAFWAMAWYSIRGHRHVKTKRTVSK